MKEFIDLAELLFELELDSITNDTDAHFGELGNNWIDKFGERSIEFEPQLTSKQEDVETLAKILKEDFDNKEFVADDNGALYNYMMPTEYGGFIVKCLEKQLADLTGIGTQTLIEF